MLCVFHKIQIVFVALKGLVSVLVFTQTAQQFFTQKRHNVFLALGMDRKGGSEESKVLLILQETGKLEITI